MKIILLLSLVFFYFFRVDVTAGGLTLLNQTLKIVIHPLLSTLFDNQLASSQKPSATTTSTDDETSIFPEKKLLTLPFTYKSDVNELITNQSDGYIVTSDKHTDNELPQSTVTDGLKDYSTADTTINNGPTQMAVYQTNQHLINQSTNKNELNMSTSTNMQTTSETISSNTSVQTTSANRSSKTTEEPQTSLGANMYLLWHNIIGHRETVILMRFAIYFTNVILTY